MSMDYVNRTVSEANMDGVQLLASLLLCYPELAKITLDSKEEALIIEFCMKETPDEETFEASERLIFQSLQMYHEIEYIRGAKFAFFYRNCALNIYRDLATFSHGEMNLLVELVKEKFADFLVSDDNRGADVDMLLNQSEMIDHRLRFLKESHIRESMVGVREEGRVMVYDR